MLKICKLFALFFFFCCQSAHAAEVTSSILDGATLSFWWSIPFIGLLASLALFPVFAGRFWHLHYGKISVVWICTLLIPMLMFVGVKDTFIEVLSAILGHYVPFVIMIGALYAISGGIRIHIDTHGTPIVNTGIMALGTVLAGWIGTTGASMLFIRPLLQINGWRKNITHIVIFFIFLVSNIGGSATPLGDPPLFLGFLNGVSFFWTLEYLIPETLFMSIPLLVLFYFIDLWRCKQEPGNGKLEHGALNIKVTGRFNFFCLGGVIGFVLLSGLWKSGVHYSFLGVDIDLQDIVRDIGLLALTFISYKFTPPAIHKQNEFVWEPLLEVGKIFFAIFVTVIPVVAILSAGEKGALAPVVSLVTHEGQPVNSMYFWLTGLLSAFLDNAPTYLVFFHMAGGDAQELMTVLARTLEAISLGAVFMGAMTYIGNAPNFMVKAIAEHRGVRMPSFFGYMVWSVGILVPLFLVLVWTQF